MLLAFVKRTHLPLIPTAISSSSPPRPAGIFTTEHKSDNDTTLLNFHLLEDRFSVITIILSILMQGPSQCHHRALSSHVPVTWHHSLSPKQTKFIQTL